MQLKVRTKQNSNPTNSYHIAESRKLERMAGTGRTVSLPSEECFLSLRVPFLHPIHPHLQNVFKMSVHVYKKLSGP